MTAIHHPPFVVSNDYARSSGLRDPSVLWRLMAPNVWVIETRLSDDEFQMISQVALLSGDVASISEPKVANLYRPVYQHGTLQDSDIPEYADTGAGPVAWWLRIDIVPPSERARFPMLAPKINRMEGLDLGELRELYSWDGTGFKLRVPAWGRE
jgi:hypothetical protein